MSAHVYTYAFLYSKKICRRGYWEMSIYVLDVCSWLRCSTSTAWLHLLPTFAESCLKVELLYFQWRYTRKSIFFSQILFLIWIDVWVMLVKKNGKQSSSPSGKAGVSSVSHRWMGLQHWSLFNLTLPFRGSERCIPFTYSRYPAGLWRYVHAGCQMQYYAYCGFV